MNSLKNNDNNWRTAKPSVLPIRECQIVSIWDTQGDAIQADRLLFGMEPIAVQKITPLDVQRFALMDALVERYEEPAHPLRSHPTYLRLPFRGGRD